MSRRRLPEALIQQIRRLVRIPPLLILAGEKHLHRLVPFHIFRHFGLQHVDLQLPGLVYHSHRTHHAPEILLDIRLACELPGASLGDLVRFRSGRAQAVFVVLLELGLLLGGEAGGLE